MYINESDSSTITLQEAFTLFRNRKKKELSHVKTKREKIRTENEKQILRQRFVKTAKTYIGIPYKKKYHEPGTEEYNSTIFLDCCALIRKVQRDLQDEFGFRLGPGNQAYQFDVLTEEIKEEEMKPGDLVFISGIYFNKKSKVYPHNMVHVEVWLGDGEKTIGARWKRGKVQIHDSYKFNAESYHSMMYYFKSIDAWLNGELKSHCPEHSWKRKDEIKHASKFSIFSFDEDVYDEKASDDQEEDAEEEEYKTIPTEENNTSKTDSSMNNKESNSLTTARARNTKDQISSEKTHQSSRKTSKPSIKNDGTKLRSRPRTSFNSFFIGGNNGVKIIENSLLKAGLERTEDSDNFFFKWEELKKNINYDKFREEQQIVNHIQRISCLTTKVGLLQTLREYDRSQKNEKRKKSISKNFFMESYCLHNKTEHEEFKRKFKADEIWICKPSGRNQGKGIFLVTSLEDLDRELTSRQKGSTVSTHRMTERIIQRYISDPLLINGFKFDVRTYMLIASASLYIVFYHEGYVRLSCVPYSTDDLDLHAHLTNQYVQKKHPSYKEKKEESVMSFDQFNHYINNNVGEEKSLPNNWVYNVFTPRMKEIMLTCLHASMSKLEQRRSTFELLGFDFMIDREMKVWLIEINVNPALHTNCQVLKEAIPPVVEQSIDVALEIFNKRRKGTKLDAIGTSSSLEPIYNAVTGFSFKNDLTHKTSVIDAESKDIAIAADSK